MARNQKVTWAVSKSDAGTAPRCAACGALFIPTRGRGRRARFCSDACKQAKYRQTKEARRWQAERDYLHAWLGIDASVLET